MTTSRVQQLTKYAAATATCADRYAYVFYPMIRDGDEKFYCCVYGGQDMEAYLMAAEILKTFGVDLTGLVEKPIAERGLDGADVLGASQVTWTERAAFSAVFERALLIQLQGFAKSDHAPTAAMARTVLPREEKHVAHGVALLSKACASPETRSQAQDAVKKLWPAALAVLGSDEARAALLDAVCSELAPLGLSVGDLET